MKEFDVIVVGAGPGGISTATKTASLGLKTLVLEKDQEIGAPVRCGEGLGLGHLKRMGIEPKKSWAVQKIFGAMLYSPSGKKIEVRSDDVAGHIIERKIFEKELAREAAGKGAKFRVKTTVTDLIKENGKIAGVKALHLGEEQEFRANVVVGADGVESQTAQKAGLKTFNTLYHIDSGFQYEMAGIDIEYPDLINLYFGEKIAPRGYVWIFPKGEDCGNVGIGIAADNPLTAKSYLDRWIESRPKISRGSVIEMNGGAVPVGGFMDKLTLDGFLVVGDAAHQVNPIHGGGMGLAYEAGQIAGQVIKDAHEKGDFSDAMLSNYTAEWETVRGKKLKNVLKKRQMFEKMTDKDFETLASSVTGDDIMKLASEELMESAKIVSKKLVKHPGLVKVLLKYLK